MLDYYNFDILTIYFVMVNTNKKRFHFTIVAPPRRIRVQMFKVSYGRGGGGGWASPCRMSIIRNGNVTLSNLRKPPVAFRI